MRSWITLILAAALGGCLSVTETSPGTSQCCLIDPGADAGGQASCWCGSPTSRSGSSYSTVVTGSSCTVTFTTTIRRGCLHEKDRPGVPAAVGRGVRRGVARRLTARSRRPTAPARRSFERQAVAVSAHDFGALDHDVGRSVRIRPGGVRCGGEPHARQRDVEMARARLVGVHHDGILRCPVR